MTNYITAQGVQTFSITIAAGNTTGTAMVNAVGSGAFICWGGQNPSVSNNPSEDFAYLALTNSTTITATRNTGTAGTIVITGCIVDGDTTNLIKSVQYGTVTIANTASTGTASINAVTNNNTAIHFLGSSSSNSTLSNINEYARLSLSGTTVTATRPGTTGTLVVGFVAIEFQAGCLAQTVQNVSATSSSSVTSWAATITSVTANNSITFFSGHTIATSTTNPAQFKMRGAITGATTLTAYANTGAAYAKAYNCCIVSFNAGVLNSAVQRGTTTLTGVASNTTTLGTTVVEANTLLSWQGNTSTSTTAVLDRAEAAAVLPTQAVSQIRQQAYATMVMPGSFNVTLSSTQAGSLIVVGIVAHCSSGGPYFFANLSVTDSASQAYTCVSASNSSYSSPAWQSQIFYFQSSASGVTSVTIPASASFQNCVAIVFEVLNAPTTGSAVDQAASATISLQSAAITTTQAYDFIIDVAGAGETCNAPYTIDSTAINMAAYYVPSTTLTNTQCTFGNTASVISTAAFFTNGSLGSTEVIQVTKVTATANATAAWELAEFVAYVAGGASYTLTAAYASFALSGIATTFTKALKMVAASASFSLTGIAAIIGKAYKLTVAYASFSLTGIAVSLKRGIKFVAATGSIGLTGIATAFTKALKMTAASASFSLTGIAASLLMGAVSLTMSAATGMFALTGNAALFTKSLKFVVSTGNFALSAASAAFKRAITLSAATGSITLSGIAAILTASSAAAIVKSFYSGFKRLYKMGLSD